MSPYRLNYVTITETFGFETGGLFRCINMYFNDRILLGRLYERRRDNGSEQH